MRFILALLLCFLSLPSAAQMLTLGAGSGGFGSVFYPSALWLNGGYHGVPVGTRHSTALTGASTGGQGYIHFWMKCTTNSTYTSGFNCYVADPFSFRHVRSASSEAVYGVNIVLDTSLLRLNFNDITSVFSPEWGVNISLSTAITSSDKGKWVDWIFAWDLTPANGNRCAAIVKNGSPLSVTRITDNGPALANTFILPYNDSAGVDIASAQDATANQGVNGGMAQIVADFNPAINPCVRGTPDTAATQIINAFLDGSGNPKDIGANCTTPTGSQPLICIKDSTATNFGSGGTFTNFGNVQSATFGPPNVFPHSNGPGLNWVYSSAALSTPSTSSPIAVDYGGYSLSTGDYPLVIVNLTMTTSQAAANYGVTTPTGWTQVGSTLKGSGNIFQLEAAFVCTNAPADVSACTTAPSVSVTPATSERYQSYTFLDYRNVAGITQLSSNTTDPTNVASVKCPASGTSTPTYSNSLIIAYGQTYESPASYTPFTSTGSFIQRWDTSANERGTNLPESWIGDYVNSGTTAVPQWTFGKAGANDVMSCIVFEAQPQ